MGENVNKEVPITIQILAYLSKNPDAEDTLEGIVQWWLVQQKLEIESARVKEALAELVGQSYLEEVVGFDNRTYYKINRSKQEEIKKALEGNTL